ncbi:hypothetical protein TEA_012378 [Camellia sinensis var. sinensis]|uniref:Uncharacterized protein n=1 Tax=Camellia sinensis var. sinensis TaxID=542762 RepID=A0A4S4DBY1_CAMSN|nr:hypothetical protein TEA_012378 [Camellia sinensis var. sinensis]
MGNNFYTGDLSHNFSYKITGSSSISLEVPVVQREDDYISGFNVGVVYYRTGDEENCSMELDDYPYLIITDKINGIDLTYTPTFFGIPQSCVDYVWTSNIGVEESFGYRIKGGEQFEFCFVLPSPFKICYKSGILLEWEWEKGAMVISPGEVGDTIEGDLVCGGGDLRGDHVHLVFPDVGVAIDKVGEKGAVVISAGEEGDTIEADPVCGGGDLREDHAHLVFPDEVVAIEKVRVVHPRSDVREF